MSDAERIERLEAVLRKLIAWSVRDLGAVAVAKLLDQLSDDSKEGQGDD